MIVKLKSFAAMSVPVAAASMLLTGGVASAATDAANGPKPTEIECGSFSYWTGEENGSGNYPVHVQASDCSSDITDQRICISEPWAIDSCEVADASGRATISHDKYGLATDEYFYAESTNINIDVPWL